MILQSFPEGIVRQETVRVRQIGWLAAFAAALIGPTGCKKDGTTAPPGPLVRTVELEGNEDIPDEEIVPHLNLQPTPPVTFGAKSYYLPGLESVDSGRIKEVYRAHGYYDAQVTEAQVQVRREDKPIKRQRAEVRFTVEEGEPIRVRKLTFDWQNDIMPAAARPAVEEACDLRPDLRFGIFELAEARDALLASLEDQGYAYAVVNESARVDPDLRLADVRFDVDPGPIKTITEVRVEGLQRVPEDLVLREVDFVIGKRFSRRRMQEVESGVYGLGVFSTVVVSRGSQTEGDEMALVVKVNEGKMQRVKLGAGIEIDPVRWEQYGTARYEHRNLGGRLWGFSARLKAGYAELPALYDPREHGPVSDVQLQFRKKGLLEKRLVWTEAPRFELGIWQGYQFYSVSNRIAASRFFTRYFELGLGYNNRFTDLFDVQPDINQNRTILGLDFRDPYFLAFVDVEPTIHLTDSILNPTNGARLSMEYDFANRYLGGQFNYHRFAPDLRGYYRPHRRLQLASRAQVGFERPYGEAAAVPIDQQFYLGGANSVRGWPLRRLAPRVSLCPDAPQTCRSTPVGGLSMVNGSVEARINLYGPLWMALFADAGDVQSKQFTIRPQDWLYTTGGGFRFKSDIGVFRLDVGGQLNTDPRFPEPRRWAIHFGIGEAF